MFNFKMSSYFQLSAKISHVGPKNAENFGMLKSTKTTILPKLSNVKWLFCKSSKKKFAESLHWPWKFPPFFLSFFCLGLACMKFQLNALVKCSRIIQMRHSTVVSVITVQPSINLVREKWLLCRLY